MDISKEETEKDYINEQFAMRDFILSTELEPLKEQGKILEIEAIYRKAIEADHKNIYIIADFSDFMRKQKKYKEAEEIYQIALEIDPNNRYCTTKLGELFFELERYAEAESCYKKAISLDKNHNHSYESFNILLKKLNRNTEVEENLKTLIKINKSEYSYIDLAKFYIEIEEVDQGIATYKQAIELFPNNYFLNLQIAITFEDFERYHEAEPNYRELIRIDPTNMNTYYAYCSLANLLVEKGRYKEAEETCKKILKIDSTYSRAYYTFANLAIKQGNNKLGSKIYKHILNQNKLNKLYKQKFAKILIEQGKLLEAEKCLKNLKF